MWTLRSIFLWMFAAGVTYYDLRYRKVPNRFVLLSAAGGFALAAAGGWSACRAGLCGMLLGFALLFPAFLLRMVGGGDVKSLAVIGLATGPGLLWISFLRGAVAGGLAGVFVLAVRTRVRGRFPAGAERGAAAWTLPYAGILAVCAAFSFLFS
ncbi:MAG: prepilin peptidase [Actinomycetota bacterium]|nr:prepilin peptidase [Actinomycetota bacterium]MDD5667449.1 prepilin peptidase [Actinomycetota bacterium]